MEVIILDQSGSVFIKLGRISIGGGKYEMLQPDGSRLDLDKSVVRVRPIGGGGFGVVVLARDAIGLKRAVKFVTDAFDSFTREIELSNATPFKNVVPILDYGEEVDLNEQRYGFYVSTFIDGHSFQSFLSHVFDNRKNILERPVLRDRLHDQTLRLIQDILSALKELDRAGVVHMDLKPSNVILYPKAANPLGIPRDGQKVKSRNIQEQIWLEAFIIDLGAGKPIVGEDSPMSAGTPLRTLLFWTPGYFPVHRLEELEYSRSDRKISYAALRKRWREIDIYSCGRVLEWLLLDMEQRDSPVLRIHELPQISQPQKEAFWREIFGDNFAIIEGVINRMLRMPTPDFHSAHEIANQFQSIPLKFGTDILASEMLTDRYPGSRIRLGDNLVRVVRPFTEVVNHPTFQRLRRIQQLSFVSEIFPEGTHSRFSHSLRTFHLAKQFVLGLNRKSTFRLKFDKKDVDELLAAALLHDVGQYHFSHTIEDLRKIGDKCKIPVLQEIRHDQEMVMRAFGQKNRSGVSIEDILEDYGMSCEHIQYVVLKTEKEQGKPANLNIMRDLISGIIDVDRVSYLLHDSERTGVAYGRAVEVGSLIEALTIKWEDGDSSLDTGLAIEEGGVSAVEAVLTATYWMYRQVYWNHHNRAFMAALKFVMQRLLLEKKLSFEEYWSNCYSKTDWDALQYLGSLYDQFLKQKGEKGVNPLSDLAQLNRLGYERIFGLRYVEEEGELKELYESVVKTISPKSEADAIQAIQSAIPRKIEPADGEILIDVPLKRRLRGKFEAKGGPKETVKEMGTKSKLYVCCRSRTDRHNFKWIDLNEYSPLAASLGKIEDSNGRKIRVFLSRSLVNRLGSRDLVSLEQSMPDILRGIFT